MRMTKLGIALSTLAVAIWAGPALAEHGSKPHDASNPSGAQAQSGGATQPSTPGTDHSKPQDTTAQQPATSGSSDTSSSPSASPAQPSGSSQMSTSSAQGKSAHPTAIDAQSLVGTKVRGSDGKDIGKVDRVMIDTESGKVHSLTIASGGGLLGGGKNVSVPWDSVKLARDGDRSDNLVVVVEQQLLDKAPSAQQDRNRDRDAGAASPGTRNDNRDYRDKNQKKQ